MRARLYASSLLASAVILAGCSQSDAPSEKMAKAAEEIVSSVGETTTPADTEAELGPYAPRNDCGELQGAESFLAALNAAIELRDTDLLVALAAEDVKLGFGGVDGADNLRANLAGEEPNLWGPLEELTSMGCAANSQGGITMPWYFAQDMQGDPFQTYIVTGENVAMRSDPSADAPVVTRISWDDVQLASEDSSDQSMAFDGEDDGGWMRVRLAASGDEDAQEGYIRSRNLRSVIDYRLLAASRNGRWRIVAFLAGD